MSDRVWFATQNNTGTPANSSGFNGLPHKITYGSSPTLGSQDFLAAWTFADFLEEYWRIKHVRMVSSITATNGTTPNEAYYTWTFDDIGRMGAPLSATRERDLAANISASHWSFVPGNTGSLNIAYENGSPDDDFPVAQNFQVVSGIHAPTTLEAGLEAGARVGVDAYFSNYDGGGYTFAGNAIVLGQSVSLYADSLHDFTITGFSVIVTPYEYWPYAASDGTPIYNTSTGALLQDPRN